MSGPTIAGILNVTADSFSDGGRYLAPEAALLHGRAMLINGADLLDVGAAASNPQAEHIPAEVEIARLAPVINVLLAEGREVSIDSFSPAVQRWALAQGVAMLNDIDGFGEPDLYPDLARAGAKLVVMHSVQGRGKASPVESDPSTIVARVVGFFERRVGALLQAGIARERLILDPGMGFFLGQDPQCSLNVLKALPALRAHFSLPILISVSRKGFLRHLAGVSVAHSGPASLAAELYAAQTGADYIRTHEPASLRQALSIVAALREDAS